MNNLIRIIKPLYLFAFLLLFSCNSIKDNYPYETGLLIDEEDPERIHLKRYPKTRSSLPSSFDLTKYAPPINRQVGPTCAGWASTYACMTIAMRIEKGDLNYGPMSATYAFNLDHLQENDKEDPCDDGTYGKRLLKILQEYGAPLQEPNRCGYSGATYYPDKITSFSRLDVNVLNFKKALAKKHPILIGVPWYYSIRYADGKSVWNGKDNGYPGWHAVCILAYDDNKFGGAFKIMNSHGTAWGEDGFIWLRYKDLGTLFLLKNLPNRQGKAYEINVKPAKKIKRNTNQRFHIYNSCKETMYVATVQQKGKNWEANGWISISKNQTQEIDISEKTGATWFYWVAENADQSIKFIGNASAPVYCYDSKAFNIKNNSPCPKKTRFIKEELYTIDNLTKKLVCKKTRGQQIVAKIESYSSKRDPREIKIANQFWNKEFALFDLLSNKIILPNKNNVYQLWVTNGKDTANQKEYSIEELEKEHLYKFSSQKNASIFIKSNL